MGILMLCVIVGGSLLLSSPAKPYRDRIVDFLTRALQARSTSRRECAEPSSPAAYDTAYRDSKDARIHSLERRNEELEEELAETKQGVEQRNELIEELWYRMNEAERKPTTIARTNPRPQEPFGQAALGAGPCCLIAVGFVGLGLAAIPAPIDRPTLAVRHAPPPTMIDLPMLTSGGEVLAPEQLYVIVLLATSYDYDVGRCFEGHLVLEPTFVIVDLSNDGEWIRIVWLLATFEPNPPIPYLQL